jgi:hypothetical protein
MNPVPVTAASGIVVDTNTKLSASEAKALRACGVAAVCRYGPLPNNGAGGDLDATEIASITGEGIVVWIIQHPRDPKWNTLSAATGAADAAHILAHCQAIGYAPGATVGLDMEGVKDPGPSAAAHAKAWVQALLAAGYRALVYIGYCPGMVAMDLEALAILGDVEFWSDFEALTAHPAPPQGWALHQQPQTTLAGIGVDRDTVLRDGVIYGMGAAASDSNPPPAAA